MFSVVVPLYNKAHTIVDTLRSVLAQDFQDFEVVVVDDGSTDDGPELVRRHFTDPRIRLITQDHAGDGAARNAGVAAAHFDWVALLDADDLWLPGYLTEVAEAIREFPDAGMFCVGGVSRNPDGSGEVRQSKRLGPHPQLVNFFEAPFFFGNANSIVFAKRLSSVVGGFPVGMPHFSEAVFFFKVALKTDVVFCPAVLTVYRLGVPGQVTSDRRENIRGIVASANEIYRFCDSDRSAEKSPACIAALVQNLRYGFYYALTRRDTDLLNYFFEATDPRLLSRLSPTERFLFRGPRFRRAAIMRIRASGLRRRIAGVPSPWFSTNVTGALAEPRVGVGGAGGLAPRV